MKKALFGFIVFSFMFGLCLTTGCNDEEDPPDSDTDTGTDTETSTDSDSDTDTDTDTDTEYEFFEDFDKMNAGDRIVATAGYPWQCWSDPPLPDEDAEITDAMAFSKPNSLHIVNNNDVVLMLEYETGHYVIEFEMFIEDGKTGYYNFQQNFTGDQNGVWGFSAYFYSGGVGNLMIGSGAKQVPFKFQEGEWFTCSHDIDIDADTATISIDGKEAYSWQWSMASGGEGGAKIDAIDFYGMPDPPGSGQFFDDVRITKL